MRNGACSDRSFLAERPGRKLYDQSSSCSPGISPEAAACMDRCRQDCRPVHSFLCTAAWCCARHVLPQYTTPRQAWQATTVLKSPLQLSQRWIAGWATPLKVGSSKRSSAEAGIAVAGELRMSSCTIMTEGRANACVMSRHVSAHKQSLIHSALATPIYRLSMCIGRFLQECPLHLKGSLPHVANARSAYRKGCL